MEYSVEQQDLLRNEKRLQNLGSDKPVCCLCGYFDPIGLIPVSNTLLEKHHLAGRHEGPVVPVCRNCHAELTEIQQFHDKKFNSPERTPIETAAAFLNGLSVFLSFLAATLRYLANWLFDLDKRIDSNVYEGIPFPLGGGIINA